MIRSRKNTVWIIVSAMLMAGLLLSAVVGEKLNNSSNLAEVRGDTKSQLQIYSGRLEGNLSGNIQLVKGLVSVIATNPDINQQGFTAAARPLFKSASALRNIGAAPDMVIRMMYPVAGNEAAIGLDYRTLPQQYAMVNRARQLKDVVLAGPIRLVQGGTGVIARLPVYIDSAAGQSEFWGLISAVLDAKRLYEQSGLKDKDLPIDIAIRGKDGSGAAGDIIFGRAAIFKADPIVTTVALPHGSWQMAAIPRGGWPTQADNAWLVRAIFLTVGLMILLPFLILMRTTSKLEIAQKKLGVEKELLRESLQKLDRLVDDIGNKFVLYSHTIDTGELLYVSEGIESVVGLSREQVLGKPFAEVIDWFPESLELALDYVQRLASGELEFAQFELNYRHSDGSERTMLASAHPYRDNRGACNRIDGIVEDISERKKAEESLRILSQAVEQAGESVIITSTDGTIEYVNSAFTAITGYGAEEVLGKNPRILKSGMQNSDYYVRLWETITSGRVWHSAVIDKRKDGSMYPALMTISPIMDDNNEISHYVGVQQDMSSYEALEKKLQQAQKMEALGTLVGGIAHDFNNMLAGITGNLYLARKKAASVPDVVSKLDNVSELSFRAADMIKQLLAFARKGAVEMKPFGLTSFIKEVSKLNAASIPENITMQSQICDEELVVRGDATQLQQTLMNLFNNARQAVTDAERPRITLSLEAFTADKDFLSEHQDVSGSEFAHLIVEDNGCGISKADIEHIFEPFFTTKEVGVGTGLGLSMVYGAIQSHGGVVTVESKPDEGTRFHLYLPVIEEKVLSVLSDGCAEAETGREEVILVVDDNAGIRATTSEVLENLGYRVLLAKDGLEAVDLFTRHRREVSLVIMDVVMPRLGGVKAVAQIRAMHPDAKVIFATGYDRDDTLKGEMPSEDYTILSKPYDIVELSRLIREELDD